MGGICYTVWSKWFYRRSEKQILLTFSVSNYRKLGRRRVGGGGREGRGAAALRKKGVGGGQQEGGESEEKEELQRPQFQVKIQF